MPHNVYFLNVFIQRIQKEYRPKEKPNMTVHNLVEKLIGNTSPFNSFIGLFVGHSLSRFEFMSGHLSIGQIILGKPPSLSQACFIISKLGL